MKEITASQLGAIQSAWFRYSMGNMTADAFAVFVAIALGLNNPSSSDAASHADQKEQ